MRPGDRELRAVEQFEDDRFACRELSKERRLHEVVLVPTARASLVAGAAHRDQPPLTTGLVDRDRQLRAVHGETTRADLRDLEAPVTRSLARHLPNFEQHDGHAW